MRSAVGGIITVIAIGVGVMLGIRSENYVDFNDQIVDTLNSTNDEHDRMEYFYEDSFVWEPTAMPALRADCERLRNAASSALVQLQTMQVLSDAAGRAFHEAAVETMSCEIAFIEALTQVTHVVEQEGSDEEFEASIDAVSAADDRWQQSENLLLAAQRQYASKHDFELR